MELHYKIWRGYEPDPLGRLRGCSVDESIWTVALCLTTPDSWQLVPASDLARVFGSITHRLAELRPVWLLFPDHVSEVIRKLRGLDLHGSKDAGVLRVEVVPPHLPLLMKILEATAFTTCFGWLEAATDPLGGGAVPETDFRLLLRDLERAYFLAVFSLYDESMEVLSKLVSPDVVIATVHEVGVEENLRVLSASGGGKEEML